MRRVTTFVIPRSGIHGAVKSLAVEHASFDPEHRRVIEIATVCGEAAAVVLRADGNLFTILDRVRALDEAWIEDAFIRASRLGDSTVGLLATEDM